MSPRRRASEIVVLCEGKLDALFVRRFLKTGWNLRPPLIRVLPCPAGHGAGEQHVRNKYANELKAYRQRSARASTVLLVVLDADVDSVEACHRKLDHAAREAGIEPRSADEAVLHMIPKRHIETWLAWLELAWLDGHAVSEVDSYKQTHAFQGRESNAHPLVDRLARACRDQAPLPPPVPPSLASACREFSRIRNSL